ncbi:major capsid protein [Tortoise microvirus 56]|nr:major capsid protein [Tortoise microvirus 56]
MEKIANPLSFKSRSLNHPRNAFDLSQHHYFTSPAGLVKPCFVMDVQPGDYVKFGENHFTRTMPVNTAAYCRLQEETQFFYVPYRLVYRWFDQIITNVDDVNTSLNLRTHNPEAPIAATSLPFVKGSTICEALLGVVFEDEYVDRFGYDVGNYFHRILDMLGYPVKPSISETAELYRTILADTHFSVMRIFGFFRVLHDYYRNSDYDSNDPQSYNIDNFSSGEEIPAQYFSNCLFNNSKYFYRLWNRDAFTSVKPSTNYITQIGAHATPSPLVTNILNNFYPDVNGTSSSIGNDGTGYSGITAQQIRGMFALDKLTRLSMLAPKTYRGQLLAHFGVDVSKCDYCSTRYLGGSRSNINIGEVIGTAAGTAQVGSSSSSSVLGQIAGKGVSSGSGSMFSFESKEHGMIIGVHCVVPSAEYSTNRIDLFNLKFSRSHFYVPEYDALGMQPLMAGQIKIDVNDSITDTTLVTGYQNRYIEYKTAVDSVHGQFQKGGSLSPWAIPRNDVLGKRWTYDYNALRVSPNIVDPIFPVVYNGTELTDSFLCHYSYNVVKVSNMSVDGIPSL